MESFCATSRVGQRLGGTQVTPIVSYLTNNLGRYIITYIIWDRGLRRTEVEEPRDEDGVVVEVREGAHPREHAEQEPVAVLPAELRHEVRPTPRRSDPGKPSKSLGRRGDRRWFV